MSLITTTLDDDPPLMVVAEHADNNKMSVTVYRAGSDTVVARVIVGMTPAGKLRLWMSAEPEVEKIMYPWEPES